MTLVHRRPDAPFLDIPLAQCEWSGVCGCLAVRTVSSPEGCGRWLRAQLLRGWELLCARSGFSAGDSCRSECGDLGRSVAREDTRSVTYGMRPPQIPHFVRDDNGKFGMTIVNQ